MNTINFQNNKISPSKVVCIGRNYVEHILELGSEIPEEMVVFFKPNSSITTELMSFHQESLHYEGEICFLYQQGRFSAVAFGIDLTKRALQRKLKAKGLPWERSKAFNGAAVFSDFVPFDAELAFSDNPNLSLSLTINDQLIQQGSVELMMYKPNDILQDLLKFMTLEDGDIVMTGTPKGVGIINAGDRFLGEIYQGEQLLVSQTWQAKD